MKGLNNKNWLFIILCFNLTLVLFSKNDEHKNELTGLQVESYRRIRSELLPIRTYEIPKEVNPEIFGSYDIRSVNSADEDLSNGVVFSIGKAVGTLIKRRLGKENIKAVVSRDVRESSIRIQDALINGLRSVGVDVTKRGIAPTPVGNWMLPFYNEYDLAITITGSHLPKEQNGIKMSFTDSSGKVLSLFSDDVQEIKRLIESRDFEEGEGRLIEGDSPLSDYIEMLVATVSLGSKEWGRRVRELGLRKAIDKIKGIESNVLTGLTIVVDPGNGATAGIASAAFKRAGGNVIAINDYYDGTFPAHHPDPTIPIYMQQLAEEVEKRDADIGIGWDVDGDRVGIWNPDGEKNILFNPESLEIKPVILKTGETKLVFGDLILAILAKQFLEENPGGRVVFDVKCSQALIDFIKINGGVPVMGKTGYPNIRTTLIDFQNQGIPAIGGEMSAHVLFQENYFIDDGVYTAAKIIEYMAKTGKSIKQLLSEIPVYYNTPELRFWVHEPLQKRINIVEKVKDYFVAQGHEVIDIDGARIMFEEPWGWALIRTSNTQPMLTLRIEAKTEQDVIEIARKFFSKIRDIYPKINFGEWESFLEI